VGGGRHTLGNLTSLTTAPLNRQGCQRDLRFSRDLSGCIDPRFLDLGFTPRPLYPRLKVHGTHWIGDCVSPRAGLDDMEK
jgi:hypothetical protein